MADHQISQYMRGTSDYIAKPFQPEVLVHSVERVLGLPLSAGQG